MKISEKLTGYVHRLRQLSEAKRLIIFFSVLIVAVLAIGFFEVKMAKKNLATMSQSLQDFKLPSIDLPEFPEMGNPENSMPGFNLDDINTSNTDEFFNSLDNTTQGGDEFFYNSPKSDDNTHGNLQ